MPLLGFNDLLQFQHSLYGIEARQYYLPTPFWIFVLEMPDMSAALEAAHATGSDPLLKEMLINNDWEPGSSRAPVMPSLIARAWL